MDMLVLLTLSIALTSLSAIDSVLTRVALKKRDYEEKCSITRKLIAKFGLDKAMIIRFLPAPVICAIFILVSYLFMGITNGVSWAASILLIVALICYSYVVAHDCIELWKRHQIH
jgi:hypothetical protein